MTLTLQGIGACKGIAMGRVHVVERGQVEVSERSITGRQVRGEVKRFRDALSEARRQLRAIKERIPSEAGADIAAFIDTHLLMLEDSALTRTPVEIIGERRCNAEWALKTQRDMLASVFEAMDDSYLRTRKDDIDHVVNRVLRILLKRDRPFSEGPGARSLRGRIVFGDDLTPADTVLIQHQGVAGFMTEFGGPNSHTAILARSLGIPAVVGLHAARAYLRDDEMVVVDGRQGVVLVDPTRALINHYRALQRQIAHHHVARRKLRKAPVVSADGEGIGLLANVELPNDIANAVELGAEGVGLYRTEYLFMNRAQLPEEDEQYETYAGVVKALRGAPVTIRTLDLGADKQVDGARPGAPSAMNPALGLRAVRLCLREPALFRPQLRAILRASVHGPVRMMVPMISSLQEVVQVKHLLAECGRELAREGKRFDASIPLGAMIEVPAAAICADLFARHLDFLSIGTNDLIQYTVAIDRLDDEVAYLYDPLHPAVLRLVLNTIRAGQKAGVPVAMCGEMAGDSRYTRLLLGLGLKEFSVHPNALLEVKQIINSSHISQIRKLTSRIMRASKAATRLELVDRINAGMHIP